MSKFFNRLFTQNTTIAASESGPCCSALVSALGSKVFLPGSSEYDQSLASYYSLQDSKATPLCIVSPETAEDRSRSGDAVLSIRGPFRGHMTSASNINGGVTIDLRALNSISVNEDRSLALVGPGATWGAVYEHLDPLGLSVNGGRAAPVGIGGLTLGGGISYTSPRYGFTCDSVSNFQIVLANGSIVDAKDDPDLLVALRGGANNFGVVTRIDFTTFKQGQIWGGMTYHPKRTLADQIEAFVRLNSASTYDEHASQILIFAFSAVMGMLPVSLIVNEIQYTKPEAKPAIFEPIMRLPRYYSTMRLANITDFSREGGGAQSNGLCFKHVKDKETVEAASRKLMSAIEEEARRQGVYDPWVYLDYAAPWQDPIASYGDESLKRLREVQMRVDPHGMFTRQVPGGFKIGHR
ncbi:hypothetical protein PG993_005891 [Apiospora rasikravindrae]|uniref:FAD-binding PCMH-type domain-containing protein n=1 Tax=Apiospora rasikravindrae TaxID=990691 RepID=A0ABR1TBU0_9PEZI